MTETPTQRDERRATAIREEPKYSAQRQHHMTEDVSIYVARASAASDAAHGIATYDTNTHVAVPREADTTVWRAIYDCQGEAQQAAEGDRPCRDPEEAWERILKQIAASEEQADAK